MKILELEAMHLNTTVTAEGAVACIAIMTRQGYTIGFAQIDVTGTEYEIIPTTEYADA